MASIRGSIVDRVAQTIDESFGGAVLVKPRRNRFFDFTGDVVVGIFPVGASLDFEIRSRDDLDRTITVGISVMRQLDPGTETDQDEQVDDLLRVVEQIEQVVADDARVLEFADGSRACLISLGDSTTVDDDAVDQEMAFLGELVAEYVVAQ